MHSYEAPKLTEFGTIEEMTRQEPPIDLEISIVIG
ncbi:MAG: lasso RiPP family leader peptide-containing protein [Actinomycetota bacterium]